MTVIVMSRTEIDRMHVLRDMAAGRITANEAAQLMRLTRRHVFRLAKAYRERGPSALVSTRRGKPSNRRYPAALRTEALGLITANYADFGPTLACEKLAERHGIHLGVETLRQWMLADGLWRDRRQRLKPVHQPRSRRDCVGELVQIDGSEHGWFEDRGPPCTLLVFVDDAASRLMLDLDTGFGKVVVGQQLTPTDVVVSITRDGSGRRDQAALASRMLGGRAMRAALNSGPMRPVAGVRRVMCRPSLVIATSWSRSRARSTSPHAGRKPALQQRSSSSLRRMSARKEQNTWPRMAASDEW